MISEVFYSILLEIVTRAGGSLSVSRFRLSKIIYFLSSGTVDKQKKVVEVGNNVTFSTNREQAFVNYR